MVIDGVALDLDRFDRSKRSEYYKQELEKINSPKKKKVNFYKPFLSTVKPKPKTKEQLKREAKYSAIFTVKCILCCLAAMLILGSYLMMKVKVIELDSQIQDYKQKYSELESENIRLSNEVKSKYGIGNIKEYVETELNMTNEYNPIYFKVD